MMLVNILKITVLMIISKYISILCRITMMKRTKYGNIQNMPITVMKPLLQQDDGVPTRVTFGEYDGHGHYEQSSIAYIF